MILSIEGIVKKEVKSLEDYKGRLKALVMILEHLLVDEPDIFEYLSVYDDFRLCETPEQGAKEKYMQLSLSGDYHGHTVRWTSSEKKNKETNWFEDHERIEITYMFDNLEQSGYTYKGLYEDLLEQLQWRFKYKSSELRKWKKRVNWKPEEPLP